jgi:O-antigen/teichoic acid export membrane protein
MSFFRNAAGLLVTSAASIPIAFVTTVVLARYLTVEDRGLYSVAMTYVGFALILGQLGWPPASIYRLRRLRSDPSQVVAVGVVAILASAAVIVVVSLLFEPVISARFLDNAPPRLFFIAVAIVPFQLVRVLLGSVAQGIDRFRYQNYAHMTAIVGVLALTSYVLIVDEGEVMAALSAALIVQVVVMLGLLAAVLRQTGISFRIERESLRDGFRFGIRAWVYGLGGQVHERVDIFMISALLGDPEQVAYYAIAAGVVELLKRIPTALGGAAFPEMAGLPERDAAEFACRVSRQSVAGVSAAVPVLAAAAWFLVPSVYGEPYRFSVVPVLILLPAMALHTLFRIMAYYFAALDRQRINIQTQFTAIALNLVLNFLLIPHFGILGAAAASLCSYALEAILIVLAFVRSSGHRVSEVVLFGRQDLVPYRRRIGALMSRLRLAR